ncbi:dTDP-4-dehydrorhamnose 3,5-epimerase family protein [Achromobacter mucicolens]|uniref:dTDP-4-dehydrorhamnose 3,5-epimerase family protein n=1 Tax=Achromobacter mucicolens TaxID=1389922 RepID=UPI002FE241DB
MKTTATKIPGVCVVETTAHRDERGAFARLFCRESLRDVIGDRQILQVNHSRTRSPGAVRGLHFQYPPQAEMKFVRCVRGQVWDVVVDLRADSPTFLQWHAETLDGNSLKMIVIPEGCAHGFQALEADSEMMYLHTATYQPAYEGGLLHNDPVLGISWPQPVTEVSARDRLHPFIDRNFSGIQL